MVGAIPQLIEPVIRVEREIRMLEPSPVERGAASHRREWRDVKRNGDIRGRLKSERRSCFAE